MKQLCKSPDKKLFWIGIALLCKAIIFFFQVMTMGEIGIHTHASLIGTVGGDTFSYLDPVDNLLAHGHYTPDYRMPGYAFIYLPLRLIMSKTVACNVLILLQWIASSVSVYYLALLVKEIFNENKLFYLAFAFFAASTFSNYYETWLMSECFCTAALVFSTYCFVKYCKEEKANYLFWCGVFVTWAFFLRLVYVLLIPSFIVILLIYFRDRFKVLPKAILYFLVPFIVADGGWTIRNFVAHKRFYPFTGLFAPAYEPMAPAIKFVKSWGGYVPPFVKSSAVCWFGYYIQRDDDTLKGQFVPPAGDIPLTMSGALGNNYIYTSQFNRDSLYKLRQLVMEQQALPSSDSIQRNQLQVIINEKFDRYRLSVMKEKSYLFYVKARVEYFEKLTGNSNRDIIGDSYNNTGIFSVVNKVINFLHLQALNSVERIFYKLLLWLGFIAIPLLVFIGFKSNNLALALVAPIACLILPGIVDSYDENRYLMPEWPFIVGCAAFLIGWIIAKIKNAREKAELLHFDTGKV